MSFCAAGLRDVIAKRSELNVESLDADGREGTKGGKEVIGVKDTRFLFC